MFNLIYAVARRQFIADPEHMLHIDKMLAGADESARTDEEEQDASARAAGALIGGPIDFEAAWRERLAAMEQRSDDDQAVESAGGEPLIGPVGGDA